MTPRHRREHINGEDLTLNRVMCYSAMNSIHPVSFEWPLCNLLLPDVFIKVTVPGQKCGDHVFV